MCVVYKIPYRRARLGRVRARAKVSGIQLCATCVLSLQAKCTRVTWLFTLEIVIKVEKFKKNQVLMFNDLFGVRV